MPNKGQVLRVLLLTLVLVTLTQFVPVALYQKVDLSEEIFQPPSNPLLRNSTENVLPVVQASHVESTSSNVTTRSNETDWVPVQKKDFKISWGSPILVEKYRFIYFPVPKAGSSLLKMLCRRMMGHHPYVIKNIHNSNRNGLKYMFQLKPDTASYWMNAPNVTRAIFVRDPKSRFLSAYLDKARREYGHYLRLFCCRGKRPASTPVTEKEQTCMQVGRESLQGFFNVTQPCFDVHWDLQSNRVRNKFWPKINFVGHLETAASDTKRLLERLGVWEQFGASGWGRHGNETIFATRNDVRHATQGMDPAENHTAKKEWHYYTPELEKAVEERYANDYNHPKLGLVQRRIVFPEERHD